MSGATIQRERVDRGATLAGGFADSLCIVAPDIIIVRKLNNLS